MENSIPLISTSGIGKHVNSASLALMESSISSTPVKVTKFVIRSGMMCAYRSSKSLVSLMTRLMRSPVCLSWKKERSSLSILSYTFLRTSPTRYQAAL